jgi:hypothetical protein
MILTKPSENGFGDDISDIVQRNLNLLSALFFALMIIHFTGEFPDE